MEFAKLSSEWNRAKSTSGPMKTIPMHCVFLPVHLDLPTQNRSPHMCTFLMQGLRISGKRKTEEVEVKKERDDKKMSPPHLWGHVTEPVCLTGRKRPRRGDPVEHTLPLGTGTRCSASVIESFVHSSSSCSNRSSV